MLNPGRLTILLLCILLLALLASSCYAPAEQQPQVQPTQNDDQLDEAASTSQPNDVKPGDISKEEMAAIGVEKALELAPQIADEISSDYWFILPESVPWWASQPVAYEEGDRSQGALRLWFLKQNYQGQGFLSDELGLLWQEGKVDGSPDVSFEWATKAGIAVGDDYPLSGTCVIDGHECMVYLHRGRPVAGDIVWRIWYDDNANLTYALVLPGQEPEVGLSFEKDFRGTKD